MNNTIFTKMTKIEAIAYSHKYANQFISDVFAIGEDGVRQFDCLIGCLESGHITPVELPDYGMDYEI